MEMTETQGDAKRLSAIDGATSLGRLADGAVLVLSHWQDRKRLSSEDVNTLQALADWLGRAAERIADPLTAAFAVGRYELLPGLDNFGTGVTSAAIEAIAPGLDSETEVATLRDLREKVLEVVDRSANAESVEFLAGVFESVAKAMLAAADYMLTPSSRAAWTRALVS